MTYLFRLPRTGVYYFRRAVPKGLRASFGKALVKESLHTKSVAEAKTLALGKAAEWDQKFRAEEARLAGVAKPRSELSDVEIRRIADAYHHRVVDGDEADRVDGIDEDTFNLIDLGAKNIGDKNRKRLARGDIMGWQPIAEGELATHGIALDNKSRSFRKLCLELMKADILAIEVAVRRQRGEVVETPPAPPPASLASPAPARGKGNRLSAVLASYLDERKPPHGTRMDFSLAVRRFIELHGDIDPGQVTKAQGRDFKAALARLPKALPTAQRKLALPVLLEALERKPSRAPKLSAGSINKSIGAIHRVLEWGHSNGFITAEPWANPMRKLKVHDPAGDGGSRLPFTDEHLRTIFTSSIYSGGKVPEGGKGGAGYWMPLLALFSGAREEELGQLQVSDVKDAGEALPYLHINTVHEGKSLKNKSSRRRVPLHPEVIRCGFLGYVDARRKAGDAALFPKLKRSAKGKLTDNWSKWFGRYLDSLGISDPRFVFHSFRHGFKDATRAAGIDGSISYALMGHSEGGEGKRYGEGNMAYPVKVLADAMAKVEYRGLDLRHLVS